MKTGFPRAVEVVRALLGFSRALQATFAITQAGLAAMIALGHLPGLRTMLIGTVACLSGSYALTAFNDMMDVEVDRARFDSLRDYDSFDLSSLFIRHPLAQGVIGYPTAVAWIASLSLVSAGAIYLLNPAIIAIYPLIALLVYAYSLLSKVTPWKTFVIGSVVVLGGLAGWLAVAPPRWPLLGLFGFWMLAWEIGGRNIPNDFADADEDIKIGMKTFPTVFGPIVSSRVALVFLLLAFAVSFPLGFYAGFGLFYFVAALAGGTFFLLQPAWWIMADPRPEIAMKVFNRSCLYPGGMFAVVLVALYVG